MCWICLGYVWCEIRQQSSEEPCDETSFGKNIQVFEILCLHRPEASPNNWKHRNGKDMEIQGPVRRETDLSPFRVVPAINLNQLCTGIFLLLSSEGKIQISNLLRLFEPKKRNKSVIMMLFLLQTRNFSRGFRRFSTKIF